MVYDKTSKATSVVSDKLQDNKYKLDFKWYEIKVCLDCDMKVIQEG